MKKFKIKLIIFDFYGVIIKGSYRDICQWLAQKHKMPLEDVYKIFYHKYFNLAAEGKVTERQFWHKALKELGVKEDWQVVRKRHLRNLILNKRVYKLAEKLQNQGYKVLILSKNTPSQFKEILKKYKVRKDFKNIINTFDLGLPKASRKTIIYLLGKFKVKPEEILMIDDQDFNLVEPKKLGVKTILYKNFNQFKKELRRYL